MNTSTCRSCRMLLRSRIHSHILNLELSRRGLQTTSPPPRPQKGAYIISQYVDTVPPNAEQLDAARYFFSVHKPTKTWTASEWRKHISQHSDDLKDITPEIAVLGRSNSGKSSLLNALLEESDLCRVGPRPGKTITMHAWNLSRPERGFKSKSKSKRSAYGDTEPKLTVLDMPGYGHGSQAAWGQEIIKYIKRRKQLRRAFVLLNPKHGVKASDEQILQVLRVEGIAHQIVACKCDDTKSTELPDKLEALREAVTRSATEQQAAGLLLSDVLAVGHLGDGRANQKVVSKNMRGLDNLRWAILQAAGLEQYALKCYTDNCEPRNDKQPVEGTTSIAPSGMHQSATKSC